jgi:hypothetical protein
MHFLFIYSCSQTWISFLSSAQTLHSVFGYSSDGWRIASGTKHNKLHNRRYKVNMLKTNLWFKYLSKPFFVFFLNIFLHGSSNTFHCFDLITLYSYFDVHYMNINISLNTILFDDIFWMVILSVLISLL